MKILIPTSVAISLLAFTGCSTTHPASGAKADSESYDKENIAGAISFPHRTMNAQSTQHLDRAALYVVYCDGIGCNASTKGALNLAKLGFRVKELIGGLDWWKRDGYKTESSSGSAL